MTIGAALIALKPSENFFLDFLGDREPQKYWAEAIKCGI